MHTNKPSCVQQHDAYSECLKPYLLEGVTLSAIKEAQTTVLIKLQTCFIYHVLRILFNKSFCHGAALQEMLRSRQQQPNTTPETAESQHDDTVKHNTVKNAWCWGALYAFCSGPTNKAASFHSLLYFHCVYLHTLRLTTVMTAALFRDCSIVLVCLSRTGRDSLATTTPLCSGYQTTCGGSAGNTKSLVVPFDSGAVVMLYYRETGQLCAG